MISTRATLFVSGFKHLNSPVGGATEVLGLKHHIARSPEPQIEDCYLQIYDDTIRNRQSFSSQFNASVPQGVRVGAKAVENLDVHVIGVGVGLSALLSIPVPMFGFGLPLDLHPCGFYSFVRPWLSPTEAGQGANWSADSASRSSHHSRHPDRYAHRLEHWH
ncbi:hypothetical protein [Streptomyces sp. CA-132043]|uniref:hypothetical protein n=1 Tax=Streptomyces sp. CA-132043 TaxID=3240048 RepID=UPI003D8BD6D6